MKNLMTTRDTAKATVIPIRMTAICVPLMDGFVIPNFTALTKEPPNMAGTDMKKENLAAVLLSMERRSAAQMVTPLLLVPGISARTWARPMMRAYWMDN